MNATAKSFSDAVFVDLRAKHRGYSGAQNRSGKLNTNAEHSLRTHFRGGLFGLFPIQFRVAGRERGDVRDPHQLFPEVFCSVDAIEHQVVFEAQGGHAAAVEKDLATPGEKLLNRHRFGVIPEGVFGMQFDDVLGSRPPKKVFAGNFASLNGGLRDVGMETHLQHALRRGLDIPMTQEQIQVDITSYRRIAVCQQGNQGTLDQQGVDGRAGEVLEDAKELCGHAQGEQVLGPHADLQFFSCRARNASKCDFFQALCQDALNAVLLCKVQKRVPIQLFIEKGLDV